MHSHARISFYGRICFLLLLLGFVFSMVNATGGPDLLTRSPPGGAQLPNVTTTTPAAGVTVTPALTTTLGVSQQKVPVPENADTCSGGSCTMSPTTYPLMHLTKAQLDEEERQFQSMEKYSPKRMAVSDKDLGGTGKSLLSYINYVPSERNQGGCGDCWVWASTGTLEVDHSVKTGINERLSTQYFNSKYNNGQGQDWACCGGNLGIFTTEYGSYKTPIPWSNTNAAFGDRNRNCGWTLGSNLTAVPIGTISTTPHYQLNSLSNSYVPTNGTGISQSTAIANIKDAIDNNKAVYYSFQYGTTGWSAFWSFWNNQAESAIFDPDSYGGEVGDGGHAVLIVGYDTSDAANPYWIVLNSWGTRTLRPNGLFRLKMNMNYNNVYLSGSSPKVAHRFLVLDSVFQPGHKIGVFRNGFWILDGNGNFQWDGTGPGADIVAGFGMAGDKPVAGNWNHTISGDKIGVFRDGTWLLDHNGNYQWDGTGPGKDVTATFGQSGDTPVTGDWNSNGNKKIGVFRNGFWILDKNGNFLWDGPPTDIVAGFGMAGDVPVVANWSGTLQDKIGIFRNGFWILDGNGNSLWDGTGPGADIIAGFGMAGDIPVPKDWNGDGKPEIAVFRPSTAQWIIDHNGNYVWDGTGPGQDVTATLGQNGDIAVAGDWGGTSTGKSGVFRNGFWILDINGNFLWDGVPSDKVIGFGTSGDIPVIGTWS